jgi:hypothetical protein
MYRITNNAKGPRGLWSRGRLVWLQPGETKTFMPSDPERMLRNRDFAAEPTGEVPDPPAEIAEAATKPAPRKRTTSPKRRTRQTKASR